jgi:hypothetical protein
MRCARNVLPLLSRTVLVTRTPLESRSDTSLHQRVELEDSARDLRLLQVQEAHH